MTDMEAEIPNPNEMNTLTETEQFFLDNIGKVTEENKAQIEDRIRQFTQSLGKDRFTEDGLLAMLISQYYRQLMPVSEQSRLRDFSMMAMENSPVVRQYVSASGGVFKDVQDYFERNLAPSSYVTPGRMENPLANAMLDLDTQRLVDEFSQKFQNDKKTGHVIEVIPANPRDPQGMKGIWMSTQGRSYSPPKAA